MYLKNIFALLFGGHCILCDDLALDYVCKNCSSSFGDGFEFFCPPFEKSFSIGMYKDKFKDLVIKAKSNSIAMEEISKLVLKFLQDKRFDGFYVSCVPDDKFGHSHLDSVVKNISNKKNLPIYRFQKTKETKKQHLLYFNERRLNVENCFCAESAPEKILLIDDVITSGATSKSAYNELVRSGTKVVYFLTFSVSPVFWENYIRKSSANK
jgi:predicted amidophosphoribosyltransferase